MDWFKKHMDAVITISTIVGGIMWMNDKFDKRFNVIEKELTIIKTVLIMKGIMPDAFAQDIQEK